MKLRGINRVYFVLLALMVAAAVALFSGWRYFSKTEASNIQQPSQGKSARISVCRGNVLTRKANSVEWSRVNVGDFLDERDKVKTMKDSTASIEFENGSILNVKENSLIEIVTLVVNSTKVELLDGRINAQIEQISNDDTFLIKAKTAQAEVFKEAISVD